jgi:rod shape-determining protein MreC
MKVQGTQKGGPRPGWLILFVALSIVIITLWHREPDTGMLHRVRAGFHAASAPVSAAGEFVTRPARGFFVWASDLGVSRTQLDELRTQNQRLRARVAELEEDRLENERLRGLVDLKQAQDLESVAARVIGRPANAWEGVITIDRGSADGIGTGMPVVGASGLLGQTVTVGEHASRVRLITDQRSGVAALVQRSRAEGIVHGSIDGQLTLDFVSTEATVTAGDVVITSGMGGIYPKGLVIGEVTSVERLANSLFQAIELEPAERLTGLEEVLVIIAEQADTIPESGE